MKTCPLCWPQKGQAEKVDSSWAPRFHGVACLEETLGWIVNLVLINPFGEGDLVHVIATSGSYVYLDDM